MRMRAVVTGASGFLGRRVVRALCERDVAVRCLVRPSSDVAPLRACLGRRANDVEVVRVDLADREQCLDAIEGDDVVFHVAAGLTGSPSTLFLNTVIPTRVLASACAEVGVRRFVLVSSLGVYAAPRKGRRSTLDETSPVDPEPHRRDPYTYSKAVQERAVWEVRDAAGLPVVVVRPGVIFGPGRGVLSGRVGLRLGRLLIQMGGRQQLPYTYVDNCADAICEAGWRPELENQVFNILDDDLPTASQLLRMLRRAGELPPTLWVPGWCIGPLSAAYEWYHRYSQGQLPDVISRYRSAAMWTPVRYSNAKAKSLLNWSPRVGFADAFQRALPPQ